MRVKDKYFLPNMMNLSADQYKSPTGFSYLWNFGSLSILFLMLQMMTGIFLSWYYVPDFTYAFSSMNYIINEVNYGWLIRYCHVNGASFFFIMLYLHMFRNMYFSLILYPKKNMWLTGMVLYLLIMATAFLGYVLPWGQMSYWAAKVMTTLFSTMPLMGDKLVEWLWGGFAVDNITLHRFFSLHFVLPFVCLSISMLHIIFLHEFGSSNPLGMNMKSDILPLHPYYTLKDLLGMMFMFLIILIFMTTASNYFNHSDNFMLANPDQTPEHMVPEWYFLFFYAILRSVPNKIYGIILLLLAITCFLLTPFMFYMFSHLWTRTGMFSKMYNFFYWILMLTCVMLSWMGGKSPEFPYYEMGQFFTFMFFALFFILFPLNSLMEYCFCFMFLNKNMKIK